MIRWAIIYYTRILPQYCNLPRGSKSLTLGASYYTKKKKSVLPLSSESENRNAMGRNRFDAIISVFVTVHPHESSALLHSFFCFFFVSFSSQCYACDLTFSMFFFRLTIYWFLDRFADFECLFRSSTFARRRCHFIGTIKSTWPICSFIVAHRHCRALFITRLLSP